MKKINFSPTVISSVTDWKPYEVIGNIYEIVEKKESPTGFLYIVRHRLWNTFIVIKTFPLKIFLDKDKSNLFYEKISRWSKLYHPNILKLYYVKEIESIPRAFIEYADGLSLKEFLEKGQVNQDVLLSIAIQLCNAINYIHSQMFYCENMKPSNILISSDYTVYLTDFCGVKLFSDLPVDKELESWSSISPEDYPLDNLPYMAPEEFLGEDYEKIRADIYTAGIVFFEIFCGKHPFELSDEEKEDLFMSYQIKHVTFTPPEPLQVNPSLSKKLNKIILKCLSKDPSERYGNFDEVLRDFKAAYKEYTGKNYLDLREKKIFEDSPGDLNNHALILIDKGERVRASVMLEEALKIEPDFLPASINFILLLWEDGKETRQKIMELFDKVVSDHLKEHIPYYYYGLMFLEWGEFEKSISYFNESLKIFPSHDKSYNLKGIALWMLGRLNEGLIEFKKAIEIEPDEIFYRVNYASALYLTEKYDMAIEEFEFLHIRRPDSEKIKLDYALALTGAGNFEKAIFILKELILVNPSSIRANLYLGEILGGITTYISTFENKNISVKESLDYLKKAKELAPGLLRPFISYEECLKKSDEQLLSSWKLVSNDNESDEEARLKRFFDIKPVKTIKEFSRSVNSIDFSPCGRYIVSIEYDMADDIKSGIKLWDIEKNTLVKVFSDYLRPVRLVRFSPCGKYIASASGTSTVSTYEEINIWDIEKGKSIKTFTGHIDCIESINFSSDGKKLVSSGKDRVIKLWDLTKECPDGTFIGHTSGVYSVRFSPCNKYIISGSDDKTLKVWDISSGEEIRTFTGHEDTVYSVVFSPCGRYIASAGDDRTIRLWNFEEGKEIRIFSGHKLRVNSICFSPCGTYLLSCSFDNTIRVWEVSRGREIFSLTGHDDSILHIKMSPSGRFFASCSFDKTIKIWELVRYGDVPYYCYYPLEYIMTRDMSSEEEANRNSFEKHILRGNSFLENKSWRSAHDEFRKAMSVHGYSKNNLALKGITGAGRYGVRKGVINSWCSNILKEHIKEITSVSFPGNSNTFIVAGLNTIYLFDIEYLDLLRAFSGMKGNIRTVAFSSCGKYIVAGGEDKALRLWNAETGDIIKIFHGHGKFVEDVKISSDSNYVVSASLDETIKLWDLKTGNTIRTFQGHIGAVECVDLSLKDRLIVSGSADRTIKVWEFDSKRPLKTFQGHQGAVEAVAFSSCGKYILSGSVDKTIKLWELESGKCLRTFEGHTGPVESISFSPDDKYFVSGGVDKSVILWNVEEDKSVRQFTGHTDCVMSVTISPCGRYVMSGSLDNTVRIWQIDWNWDFSEIILEESEDEEFTEESDNLQEAITEVVDEEEYNEAFSTLSMEVANLHKEMEEEEGGEELQVRAKCRIMKRDKMASIFKVKKILSTCWKTKHMPVDEGGYHELLPEEVTADEEEQSAVPEEEKEIVKISGEEFVENITDELLQELLGGEYRLQDENEDFIKRLIGEGVMIKLTNRVIRQLDDDRIPEDCTREYLSEKVSEKLAKELFKVIRSRRNKTD